MPNLSTNRFIQMHERSNNLTDSEAILIELQQLIAQTKDLNERAFFAFKKDLGDAHNEDKQASLHIANLQVAADADLTAAYKSMRVVLHTLLRLDKYVTDGKAK